MNRIRILPPRVHGVLDYALVVLLALAPTLFGFGGIAAGILYVVAAMQLLMSLLTNYPLGAAKVVPFQAHGRAEIFTAVAFVVMPWLLGFAGIDAARNFYLIAGIGLALLWTITDYKAPDEAMLDNNYPPNRRGEHSETELGIGAR